MSQQHHNIFEVLEYGPIIAKDDGNGLVATLNGNNLYVWSQVDVDSWINLEVLASRDLTSSSVYEASEEANQILRDLSNEAL